MIEATQITEDQPKDAEQLMWDRRRRIVRRLLLGWDQLKRPDKPRLFVEPIAADSVMVALLLKESGAIITKIKGRTCPRHLRVNISSSRSFRSTATLFSLFQFNGRRVLCLRHSMKGSLPPTHKTCASSFLILMPAVDISSELTQEIWRVGARWRAFHFHVRVSNRPCHPNCVSSYNLYEEIHSPCEAGPTRKLFI